MTPSGWIKLHRKVQFCEAIGTDWFLAGAWNAVLLKACYSASTYRGQPVERGEFGYTFRELSSQWEKSHNTIRKVLDHFESHGMIRRVEKGGVSFVVVPNFDVYQEDSVSPRDTEEGNSVSPRDTLNPSVSDSVSDSVSRCVSPHDTLNKNKKKNKKRRKGETSSPVVFPSILDTDRFRAAWSEWEQHRREKNNPLTPTAIARQIAKLAGMGHDAAIESIAQSIEGGWAGLFTPKSNGQHRGSKQSVPEYPDLDDPAVRGKVMAK